uniref:Secreted protein n=1 Tax=Panagrellus redivivus TaxID=6233 RepID=A0A7E4VDG8_PANRE
MLSIKMLLTVFIVCCVLQPHSPAIGNQFNAHADRIGVDAVGVTLLAVPVDLPDITSGTLGPAQKPLPRCKKVSGNQKSTQLLLATLT